MLIDDRQSRFDPHLRPPATGLHVAGLDALSTEAAKFVRNWRDKNQQSILFHLSSFMGRSGQLLISADTNIAERTASAVYAKQKY